MLHLMLIGRGNKGNFLKFWVYVNKQICCGPFMDVPLTSGLVRLSILII